MVARAITSNKHLHWHDAARPQHNHSEPYMKLYKAVKASPSATPTQGVFLNITQNHLRCHHAGTPAAAGGGL